MTDRKNYRGIRSKHGIVARPVRPSAAARERYHKSIDNLVKMMGASVLYSVRAAYGRDDFRSVPKLSKYLSRMNRHWERKFNELAETAPKRFVGSIYKNTLTQLSMSIKDAKRFPEMAMDASTGRYAKARASKEMGDVTRSAIKANVSLIKTISQKFFSDIEFLVYDSVQRGYDVQYLVDEIMAKTDICRERASLIARDQTNKITETINAQQCEDLGITHAVWIHSGGGKKPRESHIKADGKEYEIAEGCYIDGEYILPGEMINCRCVSRNHDVWGIDQIFYFVSSNFSIYNVVLQFY